MSIIKDRLVPALTSSFPDRAITFGEPPEPIAIIAADHSDVGDVVIYDEGCEATVCIGDKTHGHFNPYDDDLSEAEVADAVRDEVIEFLSDLFSDIVLIHVSKRGNVGGWEYIEDGQELPQYSKGTKTYLWSGPIETPVKKGWLRSRLTQR